jgi:transcription elongation GreA/GreB family factor
MAAGDLEELRAELRGLRLYARGGTAERLRDARKYGDGSNNDELLAVREEQIVVEARIALLEHVIARAVIADPAQTNGIAGIGSTVSLEEIPSMDARGASGWCPSGAIEGEPRQMRTRTHSRWHPPLRR